jgi:hypothetical protein
MWPPKDYFLFRYLLSFESGSHIAIPASIRQYKSVTTTHTANRPEQLSRKSLHPIQRPESSRQKGRDFTSSMQTKVKSLNALYFSVLLSLSGNVFGQGLITVTTQ